MCSYSICHRIPNEVSSPKCQKRDEYMIRASDTDSSYYTSNHSNPTFHAMASFAIALRDSRYLEPAQQLLDEVVCVSNAVEPGLDEHMRKIRSVGMVLRSCGRSLQLGERTGQHEGITCSANHHSSDEKLDVQIRITKLAGLLDELENQYEQYLHQIDRVVSSFEAVAGIGAAAPYTALTVQAMSKHFSNLRDAIITQMHASGATFSEEIPRTDGGLSQHKLSDQTGEALQHRSTIQERASWRPLRGLPENSVAVLRAWLFEHFLHPYPNENEKLMLATQTSLTKNQISNWFINARVRLWKPMIEEMYREEFAEDSQGSNHLPKMPL